ncbi:hypothetical protein [Helicobacter equorum]|uniref:hypothetical protein n=1 Tax=Helicobacter equorum TaxID=361872 RepID=UPI000CF17FBD|nr:hypothetical protein [Helicobacter equorum]
MIILPKFLESKLGFVHAWETYGVGIRFGEWLGTSTIDTLLIILGILFGFVICLLSKNTLELFKSISNTNTILSAIALGFSLIVLVTTGYQAPFLYFNF